MPRSAPKRTQVKPVFEIVMNTNAILHGELYPAYAPNTVGNFIHLANAGFFDGMSFHRCIRNYIIQCGKAAERLPYCIAGEFEFNGNRHNTLCHEYGTLSMSRGSHYNSASSQFFIVATDDPRELSCLDGAYAVFGKVTEGMKTVEAVSEVETDDHDAPIQEQVVRRIRVETFGISYPFETIPPPTEKVNACIVRHRGQ